MFMCGSPNGDVSFLSVQTKEDAVFMLEERHDAEGAEITQFGIS
jgi:hypothetical protein